MSLYKFEEVQQHRRDFIAALRSGKYSQGHKRLCSVDPQGNSHYCCLGVAGDILPGSYWTDNSRFIFDDTAGDKEIYSRNLRWKAPDGTDTNNYYSLEYEHARAYYGMSPVLMEELVVMNDSDLVSFHGIADFLERKWQL